MSEVTLHRAQLVLGSVAVCGRVNYLGVLPAIQGQLNLATPPWVGAMSASESWGVKGTSRNALAPCP